MKTQTGWDSENQQERLRRFNSSFLREIKMMKEQETKNREITKGRKKWYNKKIRETKQKLDNQ